MSVRSRFRSSPAPDPGDHKAAFYAKLRAEHPHLRQAVHADAKCFFARRGEPREIETRSQLLRAVAVLLVRSDAFGALMAYRAKARLQGLGVPVLPRVFHYLAMSSGQVCIGDPVYLAPGIYLPHGQIVIDGIVRIGKDVSIPPFVTIGLVASKGVKGPTIGRGVRIGTGSKILGPVEIGAGAKIGANSVVIGDVARCATVVGAPARPVGAPASQGRLDPAQ